MSLIKRGTSADQKNKHGWNYLHPLCQWLNKHCQLWGTGGAHGMVAGGVAPKYKFVVVKFHCRYAIKIKYYWEISESTHCYDT